MRPGLVVLVLLAGPAAVAAAAQVEPLHLSDHALVGRIIETRTGTLLDRAGLIDRLATADLVLIGEKHDNAAHHEIQAALIDELAGRADIDVVAFEMLDGTDQDAADRLRDGELSLDGFAEAVDWQSSGWPSWDWYRPIFAAASNAGADIAGANLPNSSIGALYRSGLEALDADWLVRTGLAAPLADAMRVELEQEIEEAHCGHELGGRASAMVAIQRARDAAMASSLVDARRGDIGVLIAGNGHVRRDRGVPSYLERLDPGGAVASIGLIEVESAWETPPDLASRFDYVLLTPRAKAEDHDYCAEMRAASRHAN